MITNSHWTGPSPNLLLSAAVLLLGACGGGGSTSVAKGGGGQSGAAELSSNSGGLLAAGGKSGLAGASSSGGSAGGMGSAGALAAAGRAGTAGSAIIGAGGGASGSGGAATGTGGKVLSLGDAAANAGGMADSADASAGHTGGTTGAGAAGNDTEAGPDGSSSPSGCSRDFLKSTIDAYFRALAAHSAATLPLSANVKFTENGRVLKVGEDGLWKTAGALKHAHSVLDTEGCNTATEAVVPEGSTDLPFALRLKLQGQSITEIETIAVRAGDYQANGSDFRSDPNAIIQSATTAQWEEPIPADKRNSREEIVAWMDKYFRLFPRGVCNTTSSCKRLENGGGSFSCSSGASCDPGQPSASTKPAIVSHIIFADVETGVGAGFDLFMGNADMHIFKMYGGQVYAVDAILGAATSTGWE